MNTRLAALVGNGLSIAFNEDLELGSITRAVVDAIREEDGNDVVIAMRELAERALPDGVSGDEDFEILVDSFGAESKTLEMLSRLAELKDPGDKALLAAIVQTSEFALRVRDVGISHVLEVIHSRSHASHDEADHLFSLVEGVTSAFDEVTFGNLNYDTLLLAALMHVCDSRLADMGNGASKCTVRIGNRNHPAIGLRTFADFPAGTKVLLLQLHGSLTYWHDRDRHVKLPRDGLGDLGVWGAVRSRTTDLRPSVVLANHRDKARHVDQPPFKLAYSQFKKSLESSDRWLIVGYSFRDQPINQMISNVFLGKKEKPRVLVATYGNELTAEDIERTLGWGEEDPDSAEWLSICRTGANGLEETEEWRSFVGD